MVLRGQVDMTLSNPLFHDEARQDRFFSSTWSLMGNIATAAQWCTFCGHLVRVDVKGRPLRKPARNTVYWADRRQGLPFSLGSIAHP